MRGEQHAKQGNNHGEIAHLKSPDGIKQLGLQRGARLHEKNPPGATKTLGQCPNFDGCGRDRAVAKPLAILRDLDRGNPE
jgi:hypothetical protein